jgi:hypothetical protein
MRVGDRQRWAATAVAKQTAKARWRHGVTSTRPLQDEKKVPFGISSWTLKSHVILDYVSESVCQRQHSIALSFAAHAKTPLFPDDVINVQLQNFS